MMPINKQEPQKTVSNHLLPINNQQNYQQNNLAQIQRYPITPINNYQSNPGKLLENNSQTNLNQQNNYYQNNQLPNNQNTFPRHNSQYQF